MQWYLANPEWVTHVCAKRRLPRLGADHAPNTGCSISVANRALVGRTVFVYAGNMGVAQGMGILIDLAERLRSRDDIRFLFIGRGSDAQLLRDEAIRRDLDNVMFYDEIAPEEIPGLYAQCHAGIVALDPRHKTHNIPGKFLTYMQAGLPVLASINPDNDLIQIIEGEGVGRLCRDQSAESLERLVGRLVDEIRSDTEMPARCKALSARLFAPEAVVKQFTAALAC
jgi:glycosyltransferase involved in cell wall biosynthesis